MLNEEIDPTACREENLRLQAVIGEQLTCESTVVERDRGPHKQATGGPGAARGLLLLSASESPARESMPHLLLVLLLERLNLRFKVSHVTMHNLHYAGLQVGIVVQHRLSRR